MMSPRRIWHSHVVTAITNALTAQAPGDLEVDREVTIRLDNRNRPEPDVVVTTTRVGSDGTWFAPEDVLLAVEVTSPESEHRDRTVKLRKYAEAGIRPYWLVEEEDDRRVVHVYELDEPTRAYAPAGIFRGKLELSRPFPVVVSLDSPFRPTR